MYTIMNYNQYLCVDNKYSVFDMREPNRITSRWSIVCYDSLSKIADVLSEICQVWPDASIKEMKLWQKD